MNELQNFSKRLIETGAYQPAAAVPDAIVPVVSDGWDDSLDVRANLRQAERWLHHFSRLANGADERAE